VTSEAQERTALFTSLAERLLQGEADENESRRAHLLRLLTSLMPAAERSARKALIERVADMPSPPKDLALRLATDSADISAPLLRRAPFSQRELLELITRSGPDHHIEIAKRADLTLDVWLALARAAARRARTTDAQGSKPTDMPDRDAKAADSQPQADDRMEGAPRVEHPPADDSVEETRPTEQESRVPVARETSLPLEDRDGHSWRFETDREGCLSRLSSNVALAFGQPASVLLGESFSGLLQAHAAAPTSDEVGNAMRRRIPLRDIVVETMPSDGHPRQWILSAQPRFSFPDGRFEGYAGVARDREADFAQKSPPPDPKSLLERLSRAADKLAQSATTPELAEYARVMKDYVEALKLTQVDRDREADVRSRSSEEF